MSHPAMATVILYNKARQNLVTIYLYYDMHQSEVSGLVLIQATGQ